jgi:hypothetical protein
VFGNILHFGMSEHPGGLLGHIRQGRFHQWLCLPGGFVELGVGGRGSCEDLHGLATNCWGRA